MNPVIEFQYSNKWIYNPAYKKCINEKGVATSQLKTPQNQQFHN